MALSEEDIIKFQELYKDKLGIEIGREDVQEKGIKLLRLMSVIHRPIEKERLSVGSFIKWAIMCGK